MLHQLLNDVSGKSSPVCTELDPCKPFTGAPYVITSVYSKPGLIHSQVLQKGRVQVVKYTMYKANARSETRLQVDETADKYMFSE